MPSPVQAKKAAPAATKSGVGARKRVSKTRQRSVRKPASRPEGMTTDGPESSARIFHASGRSARQAEQLAIIALALLFGAIGFAVHFFWFPSILLIAVLFGLSASEMRSQRGGGVISEVVTTMVSEAKGIANDATSAEASQRDESEPTDSASAVAEPAQ